MRGVRRGHNLAPSEPSPNSGGEEPVVYALRITPGARRDMLLGFADRRASALRVGYSDEEADDQAEAWLNGLYTALATLSRFPGVYQVCRPESAWFGLPVRRMLYQSGVKNTSGFHVYYHTVEDGADGPFVRIVHVRPATRPLRRAEVRDILSRD